MIHRARQGQGMVVFSCRVFIEVLGGKGQDGSWSSITFLQRNKHRFREGKELTPNHSARQGQVLSPPSHASASLQQVPWTPTTSPGPLWGGSYRLEGGEGYRVSPSNQ